MPIPSLVIVDDDVGFARAAGEFAESRGYHATLLHTVAAATDWLANNEAHLAIVDVGLPDGTGFDVIKQFRPDYRGEIVLVTGESSIPMAQLAQATTIHDYLMKPLAPDRLDLLLQRVQERRHAALHGLGTESAVVTPFPPRPRGLSLAAREAEATAQRTAAGASPAIVSLVGDSVAMRQLRDELARVARHDVPVMLVGESGTGKELAARAVHELSGRTGPFIAFNCAAVSAELLASELFGHERGSFTGAVQRHAGLFERAQDGTLFLDEIGDMPPALQAYLLRVVETGEVTRVGGREAVPVNPRIVTATHRDPREAIAAGHLREDLYYRLSAYPVHLPPLRDRGSDSLLIALDYLGALNERHGTRHRLRDGASMMLDRHPWPGNVRELRNTVLRAYLRTDDGILRLGSQGSVERAVPSEGMRFRVGMTLQEINEQMLDQTLAHFGGERTAAARALGISVRTVHNYLARRKIPS